MCIRTTSFFRWAEAQIFFCLLGGLSIVMNYKTDMARTKQHGKGAIVSALSRFIHPSEHIRNKFPNPVHSHWLVGCNIAATSEKGQSQGPVVPCRLSQ